MEEAVGAADLLATATASGGAEQGGVVGGSGPAGKTCDELVALTDRLSLSEKEKDAVEIPLILGKSVAELTPWCMVGRFLTKRAIRRDLMQAFLADLWQPDKGMEVKEISGNKFLFIFFAESDMEKIRGAGPHMFERALLVWDRLPPGMGVDTVVLQHMEVWVRVFDLPFEYRSEAIADICGEAVGGFIASDGVKGTRTREPYLRIRVKVGLEGPLLRVKPLKRGGLVVCWGKFRYERIPAFCYFCGFLGHYEKNCDELAKCSEKNKPREYGLWLRAEFVGAEAQAKQSPWLRNGLQDPKFVVQASLGPLQDVSPAPRVVLGSEPHPPVSATYQKRKWVSRARSEVGDVAKEVVVSQPPVSYKACKAMENCSPPAKVQENQQTESVKQTRLEL